MIKLKYLVAALVLAVVGTAAAADPEGTGVVRAVDDDALDHRAAGPGVMPMRVRRLTLFALTGLLPLLAQAHTHLQTSTPAADSTGGAPAQFVLQFSEATRLTALSLEKAGSRDVHKLGPLPAQPGRLIRLPAPKLDPGVYVLSWRALGDDGHITSGTLRFTIVG